MLYYFWRYLSLKFDLPGAGVLEYVTVRAIIAIIVSLVISVWFGNFFIDLMKRRNISETQRDAKIDPFNVGKKGVPTMGGLIIIAAILVPVLLLCELRNIYVILMLFTASFAGTASIQTGCQMPDTGVYHIPCGFLHCLPYG